jgi:hypothetical protein
VFDFRYHVASLTAVFVALIIGILVGVGLSGQGFVTESERTRLEDDIADLQARLESAEQRGDALERSEAAAAAVAGDAYPVLVDRRLQGKRVAVVVVGSTDADPSVLADVSRGVTDAGGTVTRMRALRMPLDVQAVQESLRARPALAGYVGVEHLDDLGRDVGRELVEEGETPLLDALSDELVEERFGPSEPGADAVVIVRTAPPQVGGTGRFVNGLYGAVASSSIPSVGAEAAEARPSSVPALSRRGLATVDNVDSPPGKLALVLLLAGADPGSYGVKDTAQDGILPPIEPLAAEPDSGG